MDTRMAYARAKASVAHTARNAGMSDAQVTALVNNAELKRCASVIATIEARPPNLEVGRKRANTISRGGKTVIQNSSKRVNIWINKRGLRDVDLLTEMINEDIKKRCKKILGDPLKVRALEAQNEREKSKQG